MGRVEREKRINACLSGDFFFIFMFHARPRLRFSVVYDGGLRIHVFLLLKTRKYHCHFRNAPVFLFFFGKKRGGGGGLTYKGPAYISISIPVNPTIGVSGYDDLRTYVSLPPATATSDDSPFFKKNSTPRSRIQMFPWRRRRGCCYSLKGAGFFR